MRPIILVSTHPSLLHSMVKLMRHARKAEEIENAPRIIPLRMGISILLNGSLGFAMLIVLLFPMPSDVQSILDSEYIELGVY